MNNFLCAATLLLAPVIQAHGDRTDWAKPPTPPDVTANSVVYSLDGKEYEGYVAYPTRHHTNPIPGVLIAHQWMGLGDMEKYRAEQMAAFGYKAFALDVYGKGIRPSNPKEAGGNSSALEADPAELHKRVNKGLSMLETEVSGALEQYVFVIHCCHALPRSMKACLSINLLWLLMDIALVRKYDHLNGWNFSAFICYWLTLVHA
jgi:hypothetical protein